MILDQNKYYVSKTQEMISCWWERSIFWKLFPANII